MIEAYFYNLWSVEARELSNFNQPPGIIELRRTMTETAQQLISSFKALPIAEQKEILLDLLRVPLETPYPAATDDELRTAADSLFLELDQRESQS